MLREKINTVSNLENSLYSETNFWSKGAYMQERSEYQFQRTYKLVIRI